jgi:hypothetical protein
MLKVEAKREGGEEGRKGGREKELSIGRNGAVDPRHFPNRSCDYEPVNGLKNMLTQAHLIYLLTRISSSFYRLIGLPNMPPL